MSAFGHRLNAVDEQIDEHLMQQLRIATSPAGRLGHYVLGFGQDPAGEMYVLTTDQTGPTGTTGQVFKLVRPSG